METKQHISYIGKNIGTGLIKTAVSMLFAIVGIALIVKNIGLTKYGLVSMALMFTGFTGLLDLGLSKSLVVFKNHPEKNKEKEVYSIFLINVLISGLIIILSILSYFFFDGHLFDQYTARENNIVISSAFCLLGIEMFNNLLRATLEAEYKLHYVNYSFVIQIVILNTGWMILSFQESFVLEYYMLIAVSAGVSSLVFQLFLVSPGNFRRQIIEKENIRNVYKMTTSFFVIGSLNSLHVPGLKLIFAIFTNTAKSIGVFEVTIRLSFVVNGLMAYISNPLFSLASGTSGENSSNIIRLTKKVFYLISGMSVVGYCLFMVLNQQLIRLFYHQYTSTIFTCLNTMLIAFLLLAMAEPIQKLSQGIGYLRLNISIKFLSILINMLIISYFIWIDALSLFSISLSFLISIAVSTGIWTYLFLGRGNFFAVRR